MIEAGIIQKYFNWFAHDSKIKGQHAYKMEDQNKALGLQHLSGGLICYLTGLGLAIITLIFEITFKFYW